MLWLLGVQFAIFVLFATSTKGLDNGVAQTPAMGFNTWYALHNHLTSPGYEWEKGFVLSDEVLQIAAWMKQNGYLALGYNYINFDDCIVVNRTANGTLVPDPQAFPNGVANVSAALHAMGFKFGWYTDRGEYTCSCFAGGLKRPGSEGHEKQDAATYAAWGVDYLKDDSCFTTGNQSAVDAYALMRDALNATKRPVYFNLAWVAGETVAKVGKTLGNEWRIAVDDGGGWIPIMKNVEVDNELFMYAGPGGWNDPGLLIAGFSSAKLTDVQGRTQFNLWSILASKLLISGDPRAFSAYTNETYTNAEVIAVDQDPLGRQGKRLTQPGNASNPGEVWGRELHDGWALLFFNNNGTQPVDIECNAACWSQTTIDPTQPASVRDLWVHKIVGTATGKYAVSSVKPDGSVMLKLSKP